MIQVTGVIALLVVSVQSSVQQKTSNNYVSSFNDGRLTNKNSWRNSQNSKPEEQWNSGQKMDRMQYLPVTNRIYNWQESNDNYRLNDDYWKLIMSASGIPKWTQNDISNNAVSKSTDVLKITGKDSLAPVPVSKWTNMDFVNKYSNSEQSKWSPITFKEISRKPEEHNPLLHWNKKLEPQFGRNRLNIQQATNNKRRYPSVNNWKPNKISDWLIENTNNNAHPAGIKQETWYQFEDDGNIWILEQNQPINLKADTTSLILKNESTLKRQAASPGYSTPSSGENMKHTTRDLPVLMPYTVPVAVPKPVMVPIAVPVVHNIRYPVEKRVRYPIISEVLKPYEKLVPMNVEVPKMVPFAVPVYTHIYKGTNGKKWHLETKF